MRQLSTRYQNDTDINNYRSPYGLHLLSKYSSQALNNDNIKGVIIIKSVTIIQKCIAIPR